MSTLINVYYYLLLLIVIRIMKVTVLQENLAKALSFVTKAISPKTQLPILGNVLLETEEGRLKLSATNLEISISFWIGATVEKKGTLTVPARLLHELVASFPKDKVEFTVDNTILQLTCGDSQVTLTGIGAEEFPPLPKADQKKDATLKREMLAESLSLVLIAASTDEGRPVLTGVKFSEKEGQIEMVATDGYRLSVKKLPQIPGFKEGVIVPARALSEASRILIEEKEEELDLYFSQDKNQIIFLSPHAQIATRLIEGEYPAYEKIIPATFTTRTVFGKDEFLKAVRLAAVYAKEAANILRLEISGGAVTVTANSPQIGENKTKVEAKIEGEGGEIAFNARFLLDLLSIFPEDEVVFEMTGPLAPGVFKPVKDDSFLHIIMPVRVQG